MNKLDEFESTAEEKSESLNLPLHFLKTRQGA